MLGIAVTHVMEMMDSLNGLLFGERKFSSKPKDSQSLDERNRVEHEGKDAL